MQQFHQWVHMVLAGPARGQLHLLYQNLEVNEQFGSTFAKYLSAHVYQNFLQGKAFHMKVLPDNVVFLV
jgi:hypothetical protein